MKDDFEVRRQWTEDFQSQIPENSISSMSDSGSDSSSSDCL